MNRNEKSEEVGVVVSQLGARMHYAVPRMLNCDGKLAHLFTDLIASQGWPRLLCLVPTTFYPSSLRRLAGRVPCGVPNELITTFGAFGLEYTLRKLLDRDGSKATEIAIWAAKRFSDLVISQGFGRGRTFFGISAECLEQIEFANTKGLKTIVEQINAPRSLLEKLVRQEAENFPEWAQSQGSNTYIEEFSSREKGEWASANLVICGSEFVRSAVINEGGDADRCEVVPYGVDVARFSVTRRNQSPREAPSSNGWRGRSSEGYAIYF